MRQLLLVVALFGLAAPTQAQTANDSRWTPWLGCWELEAENLRATSASVNTERGQSQLTSGTPRPRVCATPAPPNGATFVTTLGDQKALEQTIIATGEDRPVEDAECRGTQRAEWSTDGLRLYARAQLTCEADSTPRRVTGLALLAPNGTWLDIQAVEVGGRENVRVRRYRRVVEDRDELAPRIAATRLTLDDVREASAKISPRAIEAALVETNAGFNLTGADLIALDDAGVASSVVDVMVALSYPDRFVVERTREDRSPGGVFLDPFFLDYGFYSPLYGSFYEPYYYSPFGYSYYGRYYDPRFIGIAPIVVDGGGRPDEPQPSGAGRAVDGRGYTRVRERASEPAASGSAPAAARARSTAGTATAASSGASSGNSSSTGSSSDGSSGGVSSQGGFSSGGSSTDTGRTAVPR